MFPQLKTYWVANFVIKWSCAMQYKNVPSVFKNIIEIASAEVFAENVV